jgi:Glutaminase
VGPLQGNDGAPYVSTGHLPSPEQELAAGERGRAGGDGRHPGRRRGEPACKASGDWLYDVGVPGKSGIARQERHRGRDRGRLPGKGALATFAPPLDAYGNSVKGQLAARFLSRRLGLSLFASEPEA